MSPSELYEILNMLRTSVAVTTVADTADTVTAGAVTADVVTTDSGKRTSGETRCEITFAECRIDEEWLCRVEEGMDFVGKAIDEERRFIRVNGEVVPIEKVRRVSKESIRHLARHSELISRPQEDDVVPDKLYTVERLNDYATYENRFLYRLLATAKEFLYKRRSAIAKALGTYGGSMSARFTSGNAEKSLSFAMSLEERGSADDYLLHCSDAYVRLEKLIRTVDFYLSTPLMTELAKEASIQSAITKNNVLKMDKNFRQAVDLYEFLSSYGEDGYTVEEKTISPDFSLDAERVALLTAFAVYGNTPRVSSRLEGEAQRKAAGEQALLKERKETDPEGYLLDLERRSERLFSAEQRAENLRRQSIEQKARLDRTEKTLAESERQREEDKIKYEEALSDSARKLDETNALIEKEREEHRQFKEQVGRELAVLNAYRYAAIGEDKGDISFEELERCYETLGELVKAEWPAAKKKLRKEARGELKKQLFGKKAAKQPFDENKDGADE